MGICDQRELLQTMNGSCMALIKSPTSEPSTHLLHPSQLFASAFWGLLHTASLKSVIQNCHEMQQTSNPPQHDRMSKDIGLREASQLPCQLLAVQSFFVASSAELAGSKVQIDDCEPANFSPPLDSIQYREASEEVRTVLLSKRQCSRKCPGTSSGTMETCQAVHEQAWLPPVAHSAAAELEHAKSHGALQRCFLKLFRWQCVSTAVSNPARKAWQHLHMPKEQRARKLAKKINKAS